MSKSVKTRMWAGTAIVIMLVVGVWIVSCIWAFVGALTSAPPNVANAFIYAIFVLAGIFVLGWYVTSHWYKTRHEG